MCQLVVVFGRPESRVLGRRSRSAWWLEAYAIVRFTMLQYATAAYVLVGSQRVNLAPASMRVVCWTSSAQADSRSSLSQPALVGHLLMIPIASPTNELDQVASTTSFSE